MGHYYIWFSSFSDRNSKREISNAHSEPGNSYKNFHLLYYRSSLFIRSFVTEKGGLIPNMEDQNKTEGAPSEDHPPSQQQQQQQQQGEPTTDPPVEEETLEVQMERITSLPPEDQKKVSLQMLQLIRELNHEKEDLRKKTDNLEKNQEAVKKQYEEDMDKIENRLLEIVKKGSPEGESEKLVADTKASLKKITEGDQGNFDMQMAHNQVFGQLLKNSESFVAENERLRQQLEDSKKEPNRLESVLQNLDSYRGTRTNRYAPYPERFPTEQTKGAERVRILL